LECYFPNFEDGITFAFLAKVLGYFAWKKWNWIEGFCFLIDLIVKMPSEIAWAFPKFDGIVLVMCEEFTKIRENGC